MKYRNLVYCKHPNFTKRAYLYELPLDKDIRPGDKLCVEDRAGEHIVTAFCENWLASDKITRVLCEANGGYFPPAKVVGVVGVVTVRQEVVTKFENVPEEPEEKKGYEPWF